MRKLAKGLDLVGILPDAVANDRAVIWFIANADSLAEDQATFLPSPVEAGPAGADNYRGFWDDIAGSIAREMAIHQHFAGGADQGQRFRPVMLDQ